MAEEIDRAIAFMHACGADPKEFRAVEFYSSHEALLLDYERPPDPNRHAERPCL